MPDDELSTKTIAELAQMIEADWKKPYFGAPPYIDAMSTIHSVKAGGLYGADSVNSIIRYFLANASTWRGPVAKAVKAELKQRVGMK